MSTKEAAAGNERNGFTAVMSSADRAILNPLFEPVRLAVGQGLFESHKPVEYVYFFLSGLSSEIALANENNRVEVACVGREGLSGHAVLLGVDTSPHHAFMEIGEEVLRIGSRISAKPWTTALPCDGCCFATFMCSCVHD